ncbi:ATP-grasp fold amidoligase family protein [Marinifilum fragile]
MFTDRLYVYIEYSLKMGKLLNLRNPRYFTEKLQWLKLYDRSPEYSVMVDKIEVKKYVAEAISDNCIIPTIGTWDHADEIDFEQLPKQFVLKCNHTGGGNVFICKDKTKIDFDQLRAKLNAQLSTNTFLRTREWPYKNIKRRILCEKYMEDESGELRDYKFYCFDGKVKLLLIASNRFTTHNFDYYDSEFNKLDITSTEGPNSLINHKRPETFNEMIETAKKLSKGIPHVRVDLYEIHGKMYFGELTFFDSSGYDNFGSDEWNLIMGDELELPSIRK